MDHWGGGDGVDQVMGDAILERAGEGCEHGKGDPKIERRRGCSEGRPVLVQRRGDRRWRQS